MSYEIINAQEMARKHPTTFEVPSLDDLDAIKPDDFVKICVVENNKGGERFWIKVLERDHVSVTGTVDNVLVDIKSFHIGDEIKVKLTDIYSIMEE